MCPYKHHIKQLCRYHFRCTARLNSRPFTLQLVDRRSVFLMSLAEFIISLIRYLPAWANDKTLPDDNFSDDKTLRALYGS